MGITTTPNYNLQKPNEFEELDAWATPLNDNCDTIDSVMKANEDLGGQVLTAAGAAQVDADQALINAAAAQGDADAAQLDATQALADAAAAQSTANTADGKADANAAALALKAPLAAPALTGAATLDGVAIATSTSAQSIAVAAANAPSRLISDANHTLEATDVGKTIRMNATTVGRTLTVPNDTTLNMAIGTRVNVACWGTFPVTLAIGSGGTLSSKDGAKVLENQYGGATIEKIAANLWWAVGDMS